MGTINYGTSDYITLGFKPHDNEEFSEEDIKAVAEQFDCDEIKAEKLLSGHAAMRDSDDYENAKAILKKYSFYNFQVRMLCGYYAGSYLDIESNFSAFYNDYQEKREAQKEITELKALLKELAGIGMVSCFPGWSTTYVDREKTLKCIDLAIKQMREDARTTPTYLWYERNQHAKTF